MGSIRASARIAGVLYVLLAITGSLSLFYFSSKFIVLNDATATASRITGNEFLYRLGVLCNVAAQVLYIFVGASLYQLLKDVDRKHARNMMIWVAVGATVGLVSVIHQMAPLIFLSGADYLSVFTKPELDALAMGFLRLHRIGGVIASAFWGLWLFPFGILVIKSNWFPKLLGYLLIIAGCGYLAGCATSILAPDHRELVAKITTPLVAGEAAMMFWLVIMGAKPRPETRPS